MRYEEISAQPQTLDDVLAYLRIEASKATVPMLRRMSLDIHHGREHPDRARSAEESIGPLQARPRPELRRLCGERFGFALEASAARSRPRR